MRKLIAQEWLSTDGFAADENGSTDFFGPSEDSTKVDKVILADMDHIDLIILGANTYKMFIDFWPTEKSSKELMANRINETPKLVFSNSLEKVEWGKWDNASLENGDAMQALRKLKEKDGKNLILWGSLSLFRSLLAAGLIDQIEIRTVPVILGKGIRLFESSERITLETIGTRQYDNGFTLVKYLVKNSQ